MPGTLGIYRSWVEELDRELAAVCRALQHAKERERFAREGALPIAVLPPGIFGGTVFQGLPPGGTVPAFDAAAKELLDKIFAEGGG